MNIKKLKYKNNYFLNSLMEDEENKTCEINFKQIIY